MESSTFHSSTQSIISILAANKNLQYCINGCLPFVGQDLRHKDFVLLTINTIARGISLLPPLGNHETTTQCDCTKNPEHVLQQDFCRVLATGYQREQQRHLQAFAILASGLKFDAPITLRRLCETCQLGYDVLLCARTSSGKSLLEVLVRTVTSNWKGLKVFHQHNNVVDVVERQVQSFFSINAKDLRDSRVALYFQHYRGECLLIVLAAMDHS
jgi:hypothetical protein